MTVITSVLHPDLPSFVSFGEALTDLIRTGPDTWRSVCGGAPWNVAAAMSRLGELSAFAGGISNDVFGQELWQASTDANLDPRFIQQFAKSPLLAVVYETEPPQYFFIGDDSADLHFQPDGLPSGWRRALRWAHFGGISLVREPLARRLLELAEKLKSQGKRISFDPNYRSLMDSSYDETLERMCRIADVIKVSDEDLCGLFRSPDYHTGLAQISAWNPLATVMLTRGAEGASLFHARGDFHAQPPAVAVVDTVGAGDASMAGLLYSLMHHAEAAPEQHLRWAVAAGAAACTAAGAAPPSLTQLEQLAPQVKVWAA